MKWWCVFEDAQKELDYQRSQWSRDLRAEFPAGKTGDDKFVKWCEVELGLTAGQADELLNRAAAIAAVPDEKTWNTLGGYQKLRSVTELPKKEQVQVVEAAKSTGKAVTTVIRERGLGHRPASTPSTPSLSRDARAANTDARILAEYIRENCAGTPKNIQRIVERYVGALASRAA